jgi:hypothetical protein
LPERQLEWRLQREKEQVQEQVQGLLAEWEALH